jgi:hypothetical protein
MYSSFVHYIYIYIITGKSGGVVRIINRRTAERALLKDFIGRVIDIAFAHTDDILIGAVVLLTLIEIRTHNIIGDRH